MTVMIARRTRLEELLILCARIDYTP